MFQRGAAKESRADTWMALKFPQKPKRIDLTSHPQGARSLMYSCQKCEHVVTSAQGCCCTESLAMVHDEEGKMSQPGPCLVSSFARIF